MSTLHERAREIAVPGQASKADEYAQLFWDVLSNPKSPQHHTCSQEWRALQEQEAGGRQADGMGLLR